MFIVLGVLFASLAGRLLVVYCLNFLFSEQRLNFPPH